jgi:hypothetical protein
VDPSAPQAATQARPASQILGPTQRRVREAMGAESQRRRGCQAGEAILREETELAQVSSAGPSQARQWTTVKAASTFKSTDGR